MAQIEKPRTQKEQIDQLWWVIIGSNGDGVAEITRQNSKAIIEIKKAIDDIHTATKQFTDTRFQTCPTVKWLQQKEEEEEQEAEKQQEARKRQQRRKEDVRLALYALIVSLIASAPAWYQLLSGGTVE